MVKRRGLILPATALGLALVALAVLYWVDPAGSLPAFVPGHQPGSGHHHVKHGIAALVLGLGCFVFAWFQTGGSQQRP